MTWQRAWIVLLIATFVLIVAMFLAVIASQSSNNGFRDATTALTLTGLAAIGIERIIEGFWTFIGLTAGAWWPMNVLSKQLMDKVNSLDQFLQPYFKQINNVVDQIHTNEGNWTPDKIATAKKDIQAFQNSFQQLHDLAPDNQRAQLVVTAVQQGLNTLITKYNIEGKGFDDMVSGVKAATDDITAFVATFKDNPGKRLISIYLGVLLGLAVAGTFGLNLLSAALTTSQLKALPPYLISFGVILAGLVMGLGANPAHEIIQAISQYKQSLQAQNLTQNLEARRTLNLDLALTDRRPVADTRPTLHIPALGEQ